MLQQGPPIRAIDSLGGQVRAESIITRFEADVARELEHDALLAKIDANEGTAQVPFFEGNEEPEVSYGDRRGNTRCQSA